MHHPRCWATIAEKAHSQETTDCEYQLNQVEVWFSLLARQALRGASFTTVRQLREAIDAFIAVYNPQALPFEWTKRGCGRLNPSLNTLT